MLFQHIKKFYIVLIPLTTKNLLQINSKHKQHLLLGKRDFQDNLLLIFNNKPSDLPITCPALICKEEFDLVLSDICTHGGITHRRHDYIKSILANHSEQAFGSAYVDIEPGIWPLEDGAQDIMSGS